MNPFRKALFILVALILGSVSSVSAYPIDGYAYTGIRRLLRLERILSGEIKETPPIEGAKLKTEQIKLSLTNDDRFELPVDKLFVPDPALQSALNKLFPNLDESYSIAVMDITEGRPFRYAARQVNKGFQPGSVGKLAILTAIFNELERIYPDCYEDRAALLRSKQVRAGRWALPNIHTVPFFNPKNNRFEKRLLIESDVFSLFEWLDHMVSVSSNGAASVVWREAILMEAFCENYKDLSFEEGEAYFKEVNRSSLSDFAVEIVNGPLRDIGISKEEWNLGTFFTRGGSERVVPQGGSIGTPKGLMKWLLMLESGNVVDTMSSLEMKRLLYMTDRRIRYASNSSLKNDAVYFKSGSLYQCRPETDYVCEKYKGNKNNFMNSLAIIEKASGEKYLVTLMSNVLKRNSNNDHNSLAGKIDKLIIQ